MTGEKIVTSGSLGSRYSLLIKFSGHDPFEVVVGAAPCFNNKNV